MCPGWTEQSVEAHRFCDAVNVEQRSVVAGLGNHGHYSDLQSCTILPPAEALPESVRLTPVYRAGNQAHSTDSHMNSSLPKQSVRQRHTKKKHVVLRCFLTFPLFDVP
jgi:hypothetical protein